MFHDRLEVRQSYRLLRNGKADDADDFQKSCPWYFTFRKLDTGPRSPPPQTHTLRELSTSERNTAARRVDATDRPADPTSPTPPARAANPFLNLRPMPKRPAFLESPPPAPPTIPRGEQGHSRQASIEIDSDSDSSSVVEIIDLPLIKPKKLTRKAESTTPADSRLNFRHVSETDKVDLKRLKRQLGVATRTHTEARTTEPKIFKYIPTERDRYLQAASESQGQILRRHISSFGHCEIWRVCESTLALGNVANEQYATSVPC
jgi:hypothetical protein